MAQRSSDDTTHLDTIYTLAEAATRLRVTKRALAKVARKSGHCSRVGRDLLFSEGDLLAIWQDIREPATGDARKVVRVNPLPSSLGIMEELRWLADSPPTSVDRRVLAILRWLDRQKQPKTYKQIERCGPRTIDELLRKGMVTNCGMDDDGLVQIRIAPGGRDQIEIEERWKRKRAARRAKFEVA